VRDEEDIVDAQLSYHLNAGVDFVIAIDHESVDGTTDILESYARQGVLRRIPVRGDVREGPWRTQMSQLAATEHGADWVINTDADEFWMPRRGTLKEILAAIPERFGLVWALSRQFVPRPGQSGSFAERMTVRVSPSAAINDPTSPYRPHAKVAHRADPLIAISTGAHYATTRLRSLTAWYPADSLHFPFRTSAQYIRKCTRPIRSIGQLGQYVRGSLAQAEGRATQVYRSMVVDDERLRRGLADGTLVVDERLRDALRVGANRASATGGMTQADVDVFDEGGALLEAEIVRLLRNADGLASRLRRFERSRARRAASTL